jgi:hypothetical protein
MREWEDSGEHPDKRSTQKFRKNMKTATERIALASAALEAWLAKEQRHLDDQGCGPGRQYRRPVLPMLPIQ